MSKINISFDSKDKSFKLTKNGVAIENVDEVFFSRRFDDEDKFFVEITTREVMEEEDMRVVTRIMADGKEFVITEPKQNHMHKKIASLLGKSV